MSKESNETKKTKSNLITTIDTELLQSFKDKCKSTNLQMNTILSSFMEQFVNDELVMEAKWTDSGFVFKIKEIIEK